MKKSDQSPHPGWFGFALDFGPLLAFFAGVRFGGVFTGTGVFMVAIAIAVAVSKLKTGRVTPMLWLSALLVLVFGGLTLWLHDQRFIQIKPTAIYIILASVLFAGLARGRPLLRDVLGSAWTGLSERGWLKLSRNWGWFFVAMALLNEVLRRTLPFDRWLIAKVWGVTVASVLFAFANLPMLVRHGLEMTERGDPLEPPLG